MTPAAAQSRDQSETLFATPEIIADRRADGSDQPEREVSTASAPVSAHNFFFSATVVAMRSPQKIFTGFAPAAINFP